MKKSSLIAGALGVVMTTGMLGLAPSMASASTTVSQSKLEAQLAARATELAKLTTQVNAATNLGAAGTQLKASLAAETASINVLIAKVPMDTTQAQLRADQYVMIHDNRVYAVMEPQVDVSIQAANDITSATNLQSQEASLGSGINARKGDRGWRYAERSFHQLVNLTANAKVFATEATTLVLAQTPQGFPGNSGALLRADRWLLKADIDLAVAHFDRNVIDLFIDGYGVNSSTFASGSLSVSAS